MTSPRLLRQARAHLAAVDDQWERLLALAGPCRLQTEQTREPYEALIRAVASQQIHGKAAAAILARFLALFDQTAQGDDGFPSPERILTISNEQLRACGFSARKVESIQGIARGALDGRIPDRREAAALDDDTLIERLVTLKGIGRWTVEMLLMFSLGRMDILPVDDFGVREGHRRMRGLAAQLKPKALAEEGLAWRPYRSVAAWYLWRANELPAYRMKTDAS
ncbi:DNA-3-methyladenine glycosylase [Denitratisoma sp. agr-D3]